MIEDPSLDWAYGVLRAGSRRGSVFFNPGVLYAHRRVPLLTKAFRRAYRRDEMRLRRVLSLHLGLHAPARGIRGQWNEAGIAKEWRTLWEEFSRWDAGARREGATWPVEHDDPYEQVSLRLSRRERNAEETDGREGGGDDDPARPRERRRTRRRRR